MFDHTQARDALLMWAGLDKVEAFDYQALQEQEINRLANTIEQHMDLDRTFACLGHRASNLYPEAQ